MAKYESTTTEVCAEDNCVAKILNVCAQPLWIMINTQNYAVSCL